MKCLVVCSCGQLQGEGLLTVMASKKGELTPMLAYKLDNPFVIKRNEPKCVKCGKPPLTKGDWHDEAQEKK